MKRVWFNKNFSSVHSALSLIRHQDERAFCLLASSNKAQALPLTVAHESALEPSGLAGDAYVDWCWDFCQSHQVDIFVPGKEAQRIAGVLPRFEQIGVRVLVAATPETLALIDDKEQFYRTAVAPSAPPPAFTAFTTQTEFEAAYQSMRQTWPVLCVKPAVSVYGIGFRWISENKSALTLLLGGDPYAVDLATLNATFAGEACFKTMLLMPFLAGFEYSVDCVAHEGALICAVARRKAKGGEVGQTIVVRADIEQACADLIAQFQLSGNINIQFREGDEGLRLLEINPRLSGGVAMACLAGPNLPYLALKCFADGADQLCIPPIREGLCVGEINQALVLPGEKAS